jgi:hypothetical protein
MPASCCGTEGSGYGTLPPVGTPEAIMYGTTMEVGG